MKTNALLYRANSTVEVFRDVEVCRAFIAQTIRCEMFNLIRLAPSMVEPFESKYAVKLWHDRQGAEGAPVRLYIVCDDSGFAAHKPFNAIASVLYASVGGLSPIVGDVLIAEVE